MFTSSKAVGYIRLKQNEVDSVARPFQKRSCLVNNNKHF